MSRNIDRLIEAVSNENVIFGIRQCLKNKDKLKEVFFVGRKETEELLNKHNIKFLSLEESKEQVAKKLPLSFTCEVFSVLNEKKQEKKETTEKKEKIKKTKKKKE